MNELGKLTCLVAVMLLFGAGLAQANENEVNEEEPDGLIRDISNFLTSVSPAFLIILGIILIVGSGFAKIVGYVLIVYAIIRLLLNFL